MLGRIRIPSAHTGGRSCGVESQAWTPTYYCPMGSLSFGEILTIVVVILIIFGPDRLPEFARKVGEWIAWGRRSLQEFTDNMQRDYGDDGQSIADLRNEYAATKDEVTRALDTMVNPDPNRSLTPTNSSEDDESESDDG